MPTLKDIYLNRRIILKPGCGYFSTDGLHSFSRVRSARTGTVDAVQGPNIYVKLDDGQRVETGWSLAVKTICDICGCESEDAVCQKCNRELPYKMTLQEPMPIERELPTAVCSMCGETFVKTSMGRAKRVGVPDSEYNETCLDCIQGDNQEFYDYILESGE